MQVEWSLCSGREISPSRRAPLLQQLRTHPAPCALPAGKPQGLGGWIGPSPVSVSPEDCLWKRQGWLPQLPTGIRAARVRLCLSISPCLQGERYWSCGTPGWTVASTRLCPANRTLALLVLMSLRICGIGDKGEPEVGRQWRASPAHGHLGVKGSVSWEHKREAHKVRTGWTLHKRQEPRMERPGMASSLPADEQRVALFLSVHLYFHLTEMKQYGGKDSRRLVDSGALNLRPSAQAPCTEIETTGKHGSTRVEVGLVGRLVRGREETSGAGRKQPEAGGFRLDSWLKLNQVREGPCCCFNNLPQSQP